MVGAARCDALPTSQTVLGGRFPVLSCARSAAMGEAPHIVIFRSWCAR